MPAKIATKRLQDEQLTLGSFFGIWVECKCETQNVNTSLAYELVAAMEKREGQLLQNEALLASVYLDPRFLPLLSDNHRLVAITKLKHVWTILEERNTASNIQRSSLPTNKSKPDHGIGESGSCSTPPKQGFKSGIFRKMLSQAVADKHINPPIISNIKRILEVFADTALADGFCDPDIDILQYWENKKLSHPQLYQLATIVHAAPATQVTVERLFSGMRYILSTLRANLKPRILDDILVIRSNSQNKARVERVISKTPSKRQRKHTTRSISPSGSSDTATTPTDDEHTSFDPMMEFPSVGFHQSDIQPSVTSISSTLSFEKL